MAVIIQEMVGDYYGDYYYPHISGTAQSYNFYPVSHMEPEDGFAVVALGLGRYVVEGEKAWRFCPKYPNIQTSSIKDVLKSSQIDFYATNVAQTELDLLEGEDVGLIKLDITEAEKHGSLKHLASVYNPDNDVISPGLDSNGPRIVNFANILQYNYIPLAKSVEVLLDVVKEAMGTPIEIEYAIDLNRDSKFRASFYLLQIKPMVGKENDYIVDLKDVDMAKAILYAKKSLGNGRVSCIQDVIFVEPARFNKLKTEEMSEEIHNLNKKMREEKKNYVLIGPGRWGTKDKFIGIPVTWSQITNAKVIVETDLEDFPLDASLGSHFFHNVTSMNMGYFSVHSGGENFINYDILNEQEVIHDLKFFKHVRFQKALNIVMDGKKRESIICVGDDESCKENT